LVDGVPCAWCGMTRKSKSRINHTPVSDATPEIELDALVAVYKFILRCHESRKVADGRDDEDVETKVRLHKDRRSPCEVDD
jgi:hypothetical protein